MKPSYIKNTILKTINSMSSDIESFVRNPKVDFTRNRKCSFSDIILCILSMESHSTNREIRRFFQRKNKTIISSSAFNQQRKKINDETFPYLFSAINQILPFRKTYKGYHLLAVDGSDVNLPPLKDDITTFVKSNTAGIGYHQLHLNAVYDVLEERYVDILTQPRAFYDEREAFLKFISRNPISGQCIYTADRGYFSNNILAYLYSSAFSFVLRMGAPGGSNSFLNRFDLPDADEFDISLEFSFTRSIKNIYKSNPSKYVYVRKDRSFDFIDVNDKEALYPIKVRVVKILLPSGTPEYLITDLPKESFDSNKLKEIYRLRWGIETSFRHLKYNVGLVYFHSIRRDFIIQEVYARIILYNLTRLLINCVSLPKKNTKYKQKISIADATTTCRDFLIQRFKNDEIEEMLIRYVTAIRPNRSFGRRKITKRFIPLTNRL